MQAHDEYLASPDVNPGEYLNVLGTQMGLAVDDPYEEVCEQSVQVLGVKDPDI